MFVTKSLSKNKQEKIYLEGIAKLSYLIKILGSCKTDKQVYNVQKWGFKVLDLHYKDRRTKEHDKLIDPFDRWYNRSLEVFLINIKDKNFELQHPND
jgi:hypothetical protein